MVMPCSRSAARPSTRRAKSISCPCLEDHLAVIEKPPDQRRLAVIHRPAGDEAQHRLVLVDFQIFVDVLGDEGVGLVDGVSGFGHRIVFHPFGLSLSKPCP